MCQNSNQNSTSNHSKLHKNHWAHKKDVDFSTSRMQLVFDQYNDPIGKAQSLYFWNLD